MNRIVLYSSPKVVKKWKDALTEELEVKIFDPAELKRVFTSFIFFLFILLFVHLFVYIPLFPPFLTKKSRHHPKNVSKNESAQEPPNNDKLEP